MHDQFSVPGHRSCGSCHQLANHPMSAVTPVTSISLCHGIPVHGISNDSKLSSDIFVILHSFSVQQQQPSTKHDVAPSCGQWKRWSIMLVFLPFTRWRWRAGPRSKSWGTRPKNLKWGYDHRGEFIRSYLTACNVWNPTLQRYCTYRLQFYEIKWLSTFKCVFERTLTTLIVHL